MNRSLMTFISASGFPASDRQQMEFFAAILVRLCQQLTGRNLSPLSFG